MQMSCLKSVLGEVTNGKQSYHAMLNQPQDSKQKIIENSPLLYPELFLGPQPFQRKLQNGKRGHHVKFDWKSSCLLTLLELNSHTSTFVGYARFSGLETKIMYTHLNFMIFKEICLVLFYLHLFK